MSISISGNGSFTGANVDYSFDQSVGIAGTLTYEDVTSVDSVGIITARSGINVGPTSGIGITLNANGSIDAAGSVKVGDFANDNYIWAYPNNGLASGQLIVKFKDSITNANSDLFQVGTDTNPNAFSVRKGGNVVMAGSITATGDSASLIVNRTIVGSANVVKLQNAGTDVFRVDNDGTTRIGGTLPATPNITLNGDGSITAAGNIVSSAGNFQGFEFIGTQSTSTFGVFKGKLNSTVTTEILADGTATFKNKLTVQVDSASAVDTVDIFNGTSGGDNRVKIRTFANGGGDPYVFFDGGGNNMVVGLSYAGTTNNELVMGTGNNASDVNGLRINGLGNITIKPSNVSSVSGTNTNYLGFRITQTNNQSALLATIKAQGQSAWGGDLIISTKNNNATPDDNVTERLRLGSGGKLTVPGAYSSTTTGGGPLYVEADGDFLRYTSSLKYKTDVETIDNTRADAILNCRPVWYRSKCSNDIKTEGAEKSDWGWYGFIAEEVAEIEPRLVNWATKDAVLQEDGTNKSVERDPADYEAEGVRYENFVPLLVNLVKRQQAAIETLEAKVQALEGS